MIINFTQQDQIVFTDLIIDENNNYSISMDIKNQNSSENYTTRLVFGLPKSREEKAKLAKHLEHLCYFLTISK